MKIAILGNMNNTGFALLRYLRDLDMEAHLLLFRDDGSGYSSHFSINADTWNYSKWESFILRLPAVNGYGQAIACSLINRIILNIAYLIRKALRHPNALLTRPPRRKEIEDLKSILNEYDVFIGSGATPAIFDSLGMRLDIFFAYSTGIEYVNESYYSLYRKSKNPIIRYIASQMYLMQVSGIRNTHKTINSELSETQDAFIEIGVKPKILTVPVVYPFEEVNTAEFTQELTNVLVKMDKYDFIILSHVRQLWERAEGFSTEEWEKMSKNNDWLIEAYASFLMLRPKSNSVLILFEYGKDVLSSKRLCEKLDIAGNVIWLSVMARKEIMEIIKHSSVGVGEFYANNVVWGGVGCEILSQGCPLIHGFNTTNYEFSEQYGFPPPPLLPANSKEDITKHLLTLYDNKTIRNEIGLRSRVWFNKHNGYAAAKNFIKLISRA